MCYIDTSTLIPPPPPPRPPVSVVVDEHGHSIPGEVPKLFGGSCLDYIMVCSAWVVTLRVVRQWCGVCSNCVSDRVVQHQPLSSHAVFLGRMCCASAFCQAPLCRSVGLCGLCSWVGALSDSVVTPTLPYGLSQLSPPPSTMAPPSCHPHPPYPAGHRV